jgi:hypothetical protein
MVRPRSVLVAHVIFWTLIHRGIELKQMIIAKLQEMGVCIKGR